MLQFMPQTAPATSSSPSSTFAGMLAALASRPSVPPGRTLTRASTRTPAWDDGELADDVATLSYERALRTHARYHAPDASVARADPPVGIPLTVEEVIMAAAEPVAAAVSTDAVEEVWSGEAIDEISTADEGNRKSASITIRLSRTECEQLRRRAAEAGLTVSAYLRSCTLEAESLRAMVKDMLAQLRSEPAPAESTRAAGSRFGWWRRLGRWWPHLHHGERAAQA
jgi:hypothetical protein